MWEVEREPEPVLTVTPPEYVTAVMKLIESGDVSWDDPDVAKTLREVIRRSSSKGNNLERLKNLNKSQKVAPSARITPTEHSRIPQIRLELAREGITAERWDIKALARGVSICFNGKQFMYPPLNECLGFNRNV
ncbi:TPA: hypothetical protein ACSP7Z_005163 [Serratia fonticola]